MNRFTYRVQHWWKSQQTWAKSMSPKIELWIDKYKVIKVGCVLVINAAYAYDGILEVIVLREVQREIRQKKQFFYKRIDRRKEQVLALMKELENQNINSQPVK